MRGRIAFLVGAAMTLALVMPRPASVEGAELLNDIALHAHNLELAWFNQVQIDAGRSKVIDVLLSKGQLFALTDSAIVQAFDAETGATQWTTRVGNPDHLSQQLGANDRYVGVVNGSYVYLLDRRNGRILWSRQLEDAAGAGPAISQEYVFVPAVRGKVMAYRYTVEKPLSPEDYRKEVSETEAELLSAAGTGTDDLEAGFSTEPEEEQIELEQREWTGLFCQSYGRALVQPIVTHDVKGEERAAWPTDRNFVFVGEINNVTGLFLLRYRLTMDAPSAASPAYRPAPIGSPQSGILYVASQDGYVYALEERDGTLLWRYSTGSPIVEPPALIGSELYVANQLGGIHCIDADTGKPKWFAPRILQFVAASETRVYAVDKLNLLAILDRATGTRIDEIDVVSYPIRYMNTQTDRIYLLTTSGLVQCLREVGAEQPTVHESFAPAPAEEGEALPATEQPPAEVNPFQPQPPAQQPGAAENPFLAP
ncbi:hypothetical protein JCM19992_05880 [Thermostilla marina]